MRRSNRSSRKLNYKIYNSSGIQVAKEQSQDQSEELEVTKASEVAELSNLLSNITIDADNNFEMEKTISNLIKEQTLAAYDIDDFIDENPVDSLNIDNFDTSISKVEQLRTLYRATHIDLQNATGELYEDQFKKEYEVNIASMKIYIKQAKAAKQRIIDQKAVL